LLFFPGEIKRPLKYRHQSGEKQSIPPGREFQKFSIVPKPELTVRAGVKKVRKADRTDSCLAET